MIRFRHLSQELLKACLADQRLPIRHPRYRLRLWRESRAGLAAIQTELIGYIDEGFEDARRRIRRGFEDDLSPFRDPQLDPAANYPEMLHRVTLQGYFGETLSVIAIEHFGAHGHTDWKVPAFLFRFHDQEFQHLDSINERITNGQTFEPDEMTERRPGRTGDDALAFRINAENLITDILTVEAKCLSSNNNEKIKEAHEKLVSAGMRPSGISELINILSDYDTTEAQMWALGDVVARINF